MDSVGTVNMNVQKKFLKLWYKKKSITSHDISLTKKEGPKGVHEVPIGKLITLPNDTLDKESKVELEEEPT
jgi:hypothetical protein